MREESVRLGVAATLALLVGCSSERDLGNVPDGGGADGGGAVAFAGSYAGVLTLSEAACDPVGSLFGWTSNVVMTLGMPSPTEVDIENVTVCPVHGVPAGRIVHMQAIVCPTVNVQGYMATTIYSDMSSLTLYDGTTTTLDVRLYSSTTETSMTGPAYYDCVAQLYGTLTKQ